ncbi:MAG: metallophosphoesterase family protein [Bacilli bacterium]|nr:metallophosphoesterase family protein [Bacilli bacterium]
MSDDDLAKSILRDLRRKTSYSSLLTKYGIDEIKLEGILQLLELDGYEFSEIENDNGRTISKKNTHNSERILKPLMSELEHIRFCVVSDTHMGNKLDQRTLLNRVYQEAYDRGIDTVIHCGDITDGDYRNRRPAHPYELYAQGATEQIDNVVYNYPYVKDITTYLTSGNHDRTHMMNGGYNICKGIAERRSDIIFLGGDEAIVYLGKARVPILIKHPDDGSSKAFSYKLQEAINNLDESNEAKVIIMGHYHKSYFMYYGERYVIMAPCLVDQSDFMKGKSLKNVVGALFIDLYVNKRGDIEYFNYDELRFTDKDIIKNDYLQAKRLVIK